MEIDDYYIFLGITLGSSWCSAGAVGVVLKNLPKEYSSLTGVYEKNRYNLINGQHYWKQIEGKLITVSTANFSHEFK